MEQWAKLGGNKKKKKHSREAAASWALITGATDGIGKEFALQLAQKGFNIILAARNEDKLRAVQQQIKAESGVQVETVPVDFSSPHINAVGKAAAEKGRSLTVLVNNVGVSHEHPEYFAEISEDTIDKILMVNVMNTVKLTRAVLPCMLDAKKGLILNVGSFSGETPVPLLQTYGASKAFLKHWSLSLAAELDPLGIKVQLLNTYFVVSNLSKRKRATLTVPTPKAYVEAALRVAGARAFETPYPMHALLHLVMSLIPTRLLTLINLSSMRAVRQAALQKAQRSA